LAAGLFSAPDVVHILLKVKAVLLMYGEERRRGDMMLITRHIVVDEQERAELLKDMWSDNFVKDYMGY
jgi:hypothetical protein